MRTPTLFEDRVVFVAEDDLWTCSTDGGVARRLTAGRGASANPRFSPDGSQLAFTGTEEGVTEVMVMPSEGGPAQRLTWLGANTTVCGWLEDEVVFASTAHRAFRDQHLWAVSMDGTLRRLWGRGCSIAFDGERIAMGRHGNELSWWKRYRGGRAPTLWVKDGDWKHLDIQSACCPVWKDGRLYFLSDRKGHSRVWSCQPDGNDLHVESGHARHGAARGAPEQTSQEFYARDLAGHNGRLVWVEGHILMLDGLPLDVTVNAPRTWLQRKLVDGTMHLEHADLRGDELLVTVRGKPVQLGAFEGGATRLGQPHGVRYRLARFCGAGVVAVSDEGGEEAIELIGVRRFEHDVGRIHELSPDPLGRRVAFANERLQVGVLDLHTGALAWLSTGDTAPAHGLTWSPDGRLLAYSEPTAYFGSCSRLLLAEPATGRVERVTDGRYLDASPAFDPHGRWLYFISQREFDPVYDASFFQLGFPWGTRPYAVSLKATTPSPFVGETVEPTEGVDWDDLDQRLVVFPVHESRWTAILPTADKVFLAETRVRGGRGDGHWTQDTPRTDTTLHAWALRERTLSVEHPDITDAGLVDRTLVMWVGDHLRLRDLDGPPLAETSDYGRASGWVDLTRAKVPIEPVQERRQMLRETWRMMRDNYWQKDLPVDWDAMWTRYSEQLDGVTCRREYSDVVWRMVGELGTSHAYEMLGDYPRVPPAHAPGHLGAEFEWAEGAWRVTRLIRGEPGDPERSGPLCAPGIQARVGSVLSRVNGVVLTAETSPERALAGLGGHQVRLHLDDRPVTVTTLRDPKPLLYRDWVCRNRERVAELTDGRAGYLHIPDMGPAGYAEFFRDLKAETEKQGILVDVRYNRGGHVSQLLLEKLSRTVGSWGVPRHGKPYTWPAHCPQGPLVCLTNELAGSDGDIFSHGFKLRGLGPLIGMRTWGGVVGIWPRMRHADGSVTTQPEFACWFVDAGYGIENHGADPDIVVDNTPDDFAAGHDAQLVRAVEVLQERMDGWQMKRP